MRRRSHEGDALNMSFLDAISCGFGGVILLLVMTMMFEPATIQRSKQEVQALIAKLERELFDLRGETTRVTTAAGVRAPTPDKDRKLLAELQSDLTKIRGQYNASKQPDPESDAEGQLRTAREQLTEEMRRLLVNYRPPQSDTTVGGIPVDSEYIIFVIDNSGSMQSIWPTVRKTLSETLRVYPKIKGIQVLDNDGRYLLDSYRRKWIPDSAAARSAIQAALLNWPGVSSNPTVGILAAIETYYEPGKRISIYVFGDDFMGGNKYVESVLREVERINRADKAGQRLVRIHGVGFPGTGAEPVKFARFMRALCDRNGGTFVALTSAQQESRIEIRVPGF